MAQNKIEFHAEAWDEMLTGIVKQHLEPRAKRIAKACNEHVAAWAQAAMDEDESNIPEGKRAARRRGREIMHQGPAEGKEDYMVDTEGSNPLNLNDYRATVITVTERAKLDNAAAHTLVKNLYLAGGE